MWSKREFCNLTQSTPDSLRHYEKLKLISPIRGENNYRAYGEEEYRKVKYIKVLQYAGFSLKEIKNILELDSLSESLQCQSETTEIFSNKTVELEAKVQIYTYVLNTIKVFMNKRELILKDSEHNMERFTDTMVDKVFYFLMERNLK